MEIDGTERSRIIDTTVGRIIFNQPIPQDLGYVDRSIPENRFLFEVDFLVNKKKLGQIIDRCIQVHGTSVTAEVLDRVKAQGYKYSTKGAVTVAVCGRCDPAAEKAELLAAAEEQIGKITKQYNKGLISNEERYNGVIKIWSKTTEDVAERPAGKPGCPQPHLHDGRLRRPRLHGSDPPAGRYARPDCQHLR